MKHLSWTLLLIAATLAACSSDDDTEPQNPATTPAVAQPELRPMYVDVTENALTDEAEARQETTTRAAITTTSTLSAFSMNYMDNEYDFSKTNDVWSTNTWPGVDNAIPIDFYAYTGGTFDYNGGNPYLRFTGEELANAQHDLLVATHKNISYNDAEGHVSLHFQHACAAVNFRIGQSQALSNTTPTFKSIQIVGVCNQGTYYYDTPAWSNVSGNATYTLKSSDNIEIPVTDKTNNNAYVLDCGYLFMIPQAHGNAVIHIGYTVGTSEVKYADIPLTVNWEAGYKYTVDIRLGTNTIK